MNELLPGRDHYILAASWDPAAGLARIMLQVNGKRLIVKVPVQVVDVAFDAELGAEGITLPWEVGDEPTVNGLFKRARRALRRFSRRATRAIGRTAKTIGRHAVRAAMSPAAKAIMGAASIACPAVGGAGLAALAAAHAAKRTMERGIPKLRPAHLRHLPVRPQDRAAALRAMRGIKQLPRLAQSPVARMAMAALRSV
jgi:hypothetical protein